MSPKDSSTFPCSALCSPSISPSLPSSPWCCNHWVTHLLSPPSFLLPLVQSAPFFPLSTPLPFHPSSVSSLSIPGTAVERAIAVLFLLPS